MMTIGSATIWLSVQEAGMDHGRIDIHEHVGIIRRWREKERKVERSEIDNK